MRTKFIEPSAAKYIQYYQRGEGLPHFRGDVYGQRGAGLGSIFAKVLGGIRGLISNTPQWIKSGVKAVAKQAAKTGMDIVSDAARTGSDNKSREEWRKSAKQKVKEGAGELLGVLGNKLKQQQQQGKGIKRRKQAGIKSKTKRIKGQQRRKPTSAKTKGVKSQQRRKKTTKTNKLRTKLDFLGT